jgi:hypothetical protein
VNAKADPSLGFAASGQIGALMPPPTTETFAAVAVMMFSLLAISWLAISKGPERTGAIAICALIVAIGAAALWLLPQWSGLIAIGAAVVLMAVPYGLVTLSRRYALAGNRRAAAAYWRLASCFHPSKTMRFYGAILRARALTSADAELAAYASLKRNATSTPFVALLDALVALARNDWAGVLDHSRDAPVLYGYEVRALGELGRVEDLISAFAALHPKPRGRELELYRLVVLAFAGRVDAVRTLLRQKARFLPPDRAAYWAFVAASAAGVAEGSRDALTRLAGDSDDESFRLAAQRHLAAALPAAPPALSPGATAVIAEIEAAVGCHRP